MLPPRRLVRRAAELREKAQTSLKRASEKISDVQDAVIANSKAAARYTDDFVHDSPMARRRHCGRRWFPARPAGQPALAEDLW